MSKSRSRTRAKAISSGDAVPFERVERPLSLVAQVEKALRQAIADGRFADGKLPTEVEMAEQLSVSRETVRLAAEALQNEGLLVKIRSRGTFTQAPRIDGKLRASPGRVLAYVQTEFVAASGQQEVANRAISGLMLQGAIAEAGQHGFQLVVQQVPTLDWRKTVQGLSQDQRLRGLICASYDEEKVLRRLAAAGMPTVLLDQDSNLPGIHTVRDDCTEGACDAIKYLAQLGHKRIAYAHWDRPDMNRWRPMGYRKGLREAGLPRRREWEIMTQLTEQGARAMVDTFLALNPAPTALYCFNNTLARFAINALRRRGVRVPEDVSVIGAGGEDILDMTCFQVDWFRMGKTAVQILLRALADSKCQNAEHLLCPHTLHIGQTTMHYPANQRGASSDRD